MKLIIDGIELGECERYHLYSDKSGWQFLLKNGIGVIVSASEIETFSGSENLEIITKHAKHVEVTK